MTFYEASVNARRRVGGGVAAAATSRRTARSTSAGPFRRRARGRPACCSAGFLRREKLSAILRARVAGSGERDRPAGTYEHTDRASDLLRRKRVSVVVGTGVAFCGERASGVRRRRHRRTITTCVSDVRKKGDPGWQSKEMSHKT
jgi:hypothetical protein